MFSRIGRLLNFEPSNGKCRGTKLRSALHLEALENRLMMSASSWETDSVRDEGRINPIVQEYLDTYFPDGKLAAQPKGNESPDDSTLKRGSRNEFRPRQRVKFDSPVLGAPTNIPQLNSNPGAAVHLFLDFDGGMSDDNNLGLEGNIWTPAFDIDNTPGFSDDELRLIEESWAVVAEDYAPFDINVTTVHPGDGVGTVYRVLIGGLGTVRKTADTATSGWSGSGSPTSDGGTVSFPSFENDPDDNDVFVFSEYFVSSSYSLNDALKLGSMISHESGHGFGLDHKSLMSQDGKEDEYSPGGSNWTPIMGNSLSTDRTIWTQPKFTHQFVPEIQWTEGSDDFAMLTDAIGLRADDHPEAWFGNTDLGNIESGATLSDTGIIGTIHDLDIFQFDVSEPGIVNIELSVAEIGANLNGTLTLFSYAANTGLVQLEVSAPGGDLNAAISRYLAAGTYAVFVGSAGYFTGDVGNYSLEVSKALGIKLVEPESSPHEVETGLVIQQAILDLPETERTDIEPISDTTSELASLDQAFRAILLPAANPSTGTRGSEELTYTEWPDHAEDAEAYHLDLELAFEDLSIAFV